MLRHLEGKVSERKRRLFACACARRFWEVLKDESYRRAVEVAERFADGKADSQELRHAELEADPGPEFHSQSRAILLSASKAATAPPCRCENAAHLAEKGALYRAFCEATTAGRRQMQGDPQAAEKIVQAAILHDIVGNPFCPVFADPAWMCWNDGAINRIAQTIYEERRYTDMPILADALEEAGCARESILAHCRQTGEHVRGCWVIDLLLGKPGKQRGRIYFLE